VTLFPPNLPREIRAAIVILPNELQVKRTQNSADAGNAPSCYARIPAASVNSLHSRIEVTFRKMCKHET
jgi:hypothetical protein